MKGTGFCQYDSTNPKQLQEQKESIPPLANPKQLQEKKENIPPSIGLQL
jgi:hypothetical protein